MNTLTHNQYSQKYTITIQPDGFAFPYTFTCLTLKNAMFIIQDIKEQYGITITADMYDITHISKS